MRASLAVGRSLAEFREAFPDEASCAAYLFKRRWPEGFVCPMCDGARYASLASRAYTYECLGCGHQASITAGTLMHRSHLPLTKWFLAAYLITTHRRSLSARELQERLRISYQTAWLLKRKLQFSKTRADSRPLEGLVEVAQREIRVEVGDRFPGPAPTYKIVFVIALEVADAQLTQLQPLIAPQLAQIRLAPLTDNSEASIKSFIRDNVKLGTTLLTEDLDAFLGLLGSGYDLRDFDAAMPQARHVLSALEDWLRARRVLWSDHLDELVKDFTAELNWRSEFDRVLQFALRQQPTSHWDIVGEENPRKGNPTVRRGPRYRKTATGMRQDGSGLLRPFYATGRPRPPSRGC